jgi:PAS domain S-box-containing protein
MPSRPMILNVDDNEGCRYAVTRILEHHSFRVVEAANGSEALRLARAEKPDLVLLDLNLPDINGFEVCRLLKAEPATSTIPVLHITASFLSSADMARGLESGADNYLVEPVEPEVLVATINSALRARRAEESAVRMAREWQASFDAISDGIALVDTHGKIQRCNGMLGILLDRPVSELVGEDCHNLWGHLPRERQPFFRAMESRNRESVELEVDSRLLHVSVDPILDETGAPTGAVQIVRDMTERRRLEEQFREGQKFETIGTLAAGVAHDFNNLLTSVMGNASLVLSYLPSDSKLRDKLDDIVRSSQRAADLTRQLLAYSGKGRHFMQRIELSNLARQIENLVEAAVPKKVTLEMRLARELPEIEADVNQIQQVVLNLVSNAAEAIGEDAGTIAISTGSDHHSVYLEVRDTGCGMDPDTKARMFDPFFTTKFTGRGLGLAAVAGIVRSHKGNIQVTSAPGEGSIFRVSFPQVEEPAPAVHRSPEAATLTGAGSGTVLVVDDEEMVRRIARATLEVRGYKVLLASDGLQAIQKVKAHPEIDLVLLDLTMPVMNGEEAIDDIMASHPGMRVIVSTGYDHREAVARFNRKMVSGFLQKPYTSRQLAEKVHAVLGSDDPTELKSGTEEVPHVLKPAPRH